ncbi:MAG: hypothetical protein WCV00_10340 [Verrucomicrobiia bacterium]|jgi:hypothetical protein
MKRPLSLYFVAALCFVAAYLGISSVISEVIYRLVPIDIREKWQFWTLFVVPLAMAMWPVVGLLKLKPIQRWICVAFLVYLTTLFGCCLVLTVQFISEWFSLKHLESHDIMPLVAYPALIVIEFIAIVVSILCIRYLSRRSFGEFARQFVEEREKQKTCATKSG